MKVQDLSEEDILNYLMISEFNEGLTPDEFKFLLYKFRYNYRLLYSRIESIKVEREKLQTDLLECKEINKNKIENLNSEKEKLENKNKKILERRLSWKERIKGKIILKENEIDRL